MQALVEGILELRRSLVALAVFKALLDSLLIGSVAYLLMVIARLSWIIVPVAIALFFSFRFTREMDNVNFRTVESKTPQLRERLTTAVDYIASNNPIAQELKMDVTGDMKLISTSDYISKHKLIITPLMILAVLFGSIFYSSLNISIAHYLNPFVDAPEDKTPTFPGFYTINESALNFEEGAGDIYGESSIAKLIGKPISLELNPLATSVDINKLTEQKPRSSRFSEIPDIEADQDATYQGDIPVEQQDTVKRYFDQIDIG